MLNSVIKPQPSITAQPKAQRVQQGKLQAGPLVQRKPQPARRIMASATQKDDADQFVAGKDSATLDQETYKKICAKWEASGVPLQHLSKEDYKKICAEWEVDPTYDFSDLPKLYDHLIHDDETRKKIRARRDIQSAEELKMRGKLEYKVKNAARSVAEGFDSVVTNRRKILEEMAAGSFTLGLLGGPKLLLGGAISDANCTEIVTSAGKGPLDTEKAFNQFFKTLSVFTGPLTEPQKKEMREVVIKAKKEGKPICLPVPQKVLPVTPVAAAGLYDASFLAISGMGAGIMTAEVLASALAIQQVVGILAVGIGWAVADANKQIIFIPKNSKPEDVSKLLR